MNAFCQDKKKGDLAENSFAMTAIQLGRGMLDRPFTTDAGRHVDMIVFGPESNGSQEGCGRIKWTIVDVKGAQKAPSIEDVMKGRGAFLIEWKSGENGLCTPLSDEDTWVQCIVLVRIRDGQEMGYHSFYLLNVDDLRAFYLKYNDGSGNYIKPHRGYPHAVLIDCNQFAKEHGFVYVEYDSREGVWTYKVFGEYHDPSMYTDADPLLSICLDRRIETLHESLQKGSFDFGQMCMSKGATADMFFGGDMSRMDEYIKTAVKHYDEKYELCPIGMVNKRTEVH